MSPAAQLGSETVVTNGAAAIAQPLVREFRHVSIKEKGEKKKSLPSSSSSNHEDD